MVLLQMLLGLSTLRLGLAVPAITVGHQALAALLVALLSAGIGAGIGRNFVVPARDQGAEAPFSDTTSGLIHG